MVEILRRCLSDPLRMTIGDGWWLVARDTTSSFVWECLVH
jgi:hypothetical protein